MNIQLHSHSDDALLRRFDLRVYIPLPCYTTRLALLKLRLKDAKIADDVDLEAVATRLGGYTGCDIGSICRKASLMGIRRSVQWEICDSLQTDSSSLPSDSCRNEYGQAGSTNLRSRLHRCHRQYSFICCTVIIGSIQNVGSRARIDMIVFCTHIVLLIVYTHCTRGLYLKIKTLLTTCYAQCHRMTWGDSHTDTGII